MLKQPNKQLEITQCDLPSNLLPRVGERKILGRIWMVRLEEMRERNVKENCVSIKLC